MNAQLHDQITTIPAPAPLARAVALELDQRVFTLPVQNTQYACMEFGERGVLIIGGQADNQTWSQFMAQVYQLMASVSPHEFASLGATTAG